MILPQHSKKWNVRCWPLMAKKTCRSRQRKIYLPLKPHWKKGKNNKVTVKELPGLNHLFQECKTGSPDEYMKIEQTFSPAALEEINQWMIKTVWNRKVAIHPKPDMPEVYLYGMISPSTVYVLDEDFAFRSRTNMLKSKKTCHRWRWAVNSAIMLSKLGIKTKLDGHMDQWKTRKYHMETAESLWYRYFTVNG